jgi:hypothetical protein
VLDSGVFPSREIDSIRVDSQGEEMAYIAAWPSPRGAWQVEGTAFIPGIPSTQKRVLLRTLDGAQTVIHFLVGSYHEVTQRNADPAAARVERAMRAGLELAKGEGPLHPGSLPQYPVPIPAYRDAVAVPLPILAIDARQRGLYAPPRFAVVRWPSAEPLGMGDVPSFDPDNWPPPRLSDWPPSTVRAWEPGRLAGAIERFTAVWGRLLDVWFGGTSYPQLADEKHEARLLLELLLPPGMLNLYADLSPAFWAWLGEASA